MPARVVDLRLVPVAVAAWVTVLVLVQACSWAVGQRNAYALSVALVLASVLLGAAALLMRSSVVIGVGVGMLAVGVHLVALTAPPVAEWVRSGATASVEAGITADPQQRVMGHQPVWGAAALVEVPA
ncbi:MAG: hypothetical protein ACKN9D_01410, partial [Actinomycetales bacterium]